MVSKAAVIGQKQKEHGRNRGKFLGVSGRSCLHQCCSQSITRTGHVDSHGCKKVPGGRSDVSDGQLTSDISTKA